MYEFFILQPQQNVHSQQSPINKSYDWFQCRYQRFVSLLLTVKPEHIEEKEFRGDGKCCATLASA